ncbi:MAG: phage tail tape measure protein [Oscillospiraceae bacterium]
MANVTPDIRILVGNLGDASEFGQSANLIRTNLEKALAGGIKIKIIPDTSAFTGAASANGASVVNTAAIQKETQAYQQNAQAKMQSNAATSSGVQSANAEASAIKNKTNLLGQETAQRRINTQATQQSARAMQAESAALTKLETSQVSFQNYLTTLNPKALTQFSSEIAHINTLLGQGTKEASTQANLEIQKLKAQMKSLGYEGGTAFTTLIGKMKTYASYFASSMIIMGLYSGITNLISNVKDLDEAMTDLRIVTGGTREETEGLLKTYNQMAQRVGSTTSEVASSATSWMRQGYNIEDTDKLIETSMVFSKVGFLEADEAAQALTSTIKGYKLAVEDAMGAIDAFTVLDLDLATSAGEIATALAQTASSAEMAGISLEKAASQIGVVLEVTQASGEEVGTFYKTLMARLSNIKAGRLEDPETGESLDTWGIAA